MCRARTIALALALAACTKKTPPPPPAPVVDAAVITSGELDDLLHFTDAHLAVSSKVDNPHDLAEHIADGRLDTAWNGKTGDLVGAWFGFRVPAAARVRLIELAVGYDAKSKNGEDLFTMNQRIAKVRVTRDGVSLGEHSLDPDRRGLQRIAVDAAGGEFKIEVLAVKAGTRKDWKEVVVSELRVYGHAGAAKRRTAALPLVGVGGFDARPAYAGGRDAGTRAKPPAPTKAVRTAAELCAEWSAVTSDEVDVPENSPCGRMTKVRKLCSGNEIEAEDGVQIFAMETAAATERSALAIGYAGRVEWLPITLSEQWICDPGCGGQYKGGAFHSLRVDFVSLHEPKKAVITYVTWLHNTAAYVEHADGGFDRRTTTTYTRHELTCVLSTTLDCKETDVETKEVSSPSDAPGPYAVWPAP